MNVELEKFVSELDRDTFAALKWLNAFQRRVTSELGRLAFDLVPKHPEYGTAVRKAMKEVTENVAKYRTHPYAENINFAGPFQYYEQEFFDPENYADGIPQERKDYDQFVKVATELESTAKNFTSRFLDKYGIATRKRLYRSIPPDQAKAFNDAWFTFFGALDDPKGVIPALQDLYYDLKALV